MISREDIDNCPYRKCSKCGWVHPPTSYALTNCKRCSEPLDTQICEGCKRVLATEDMAIRYVRNKEVIERYCSICYAQRTKPNVPLAKRMTGRGFREKVRKALALQEVFDERVAFYKTTQFATLKFGVRRTHKVVDRKYRGCAICEGPIEGHMMLIKHQYGGNYEPTNVIPTCEKCMLILTYDSNPLVCFNRISNRADGDAYLFKIVLKLLKKVGIKDKYDLWVED